MSEKQDGHAARTAAELEQKYNFGKTFAEVIGLATDARNTAEEVKSTLEGMGAEEIFNLLTDNGTAQGLFRDENGNYYFNGEYIKSLNITVKDSVYVAPGEEEIETVKNHLSGQSTIPSAKQALYDVNGDGDITLSDMANLRLASMGLLSVSKFSNAVKTDVEVTLNLKDPEKILRIKGTNMWGRSFNNYIGVNGSNIKNTDYADYITEQGESGIWTYRKWASGIAECWGSVSGSYSITTAYGDGYISDAVFESFPTGLFSKAPIANVSFNCGNYGVTTVSMRDLGVSGVGAVLYDAVSATRKGKYTFSAKGIWK